MINVNNTAINIATGLDRVKLRVEFFNSNEQSGDPGGLPYRWIVKSMIPLSFFLLIITSIGFFIKNLNIYRDENKWLEF